MLGYDVEDPESEEDDRILEQAGKNGLNLLTMDEELHARAKRKGIQTLLVTSNYNPRQVAQIMREFSLSLEGFPSRTRCSTCNGRLKEAGKADVKGSVREKSYDAHEQFWLCTSCGQVFWEGAHWDRIKMEVEKIRKELRR